MINKLYYLLFIIAVSLAFLPKAMSKGLLVDSWTPYTQLFLAQCMIAEADESEEDHIAIAYAARNWWQLRQKRYPRLRYIDQLKAYCSVHRLGLKRLQRRQKWIRQLGFPMVLPDGASVVEKPKFFPRSASWERKRRVWLETLERAERWNQGKLKDPCHGKAVHWGAPSDPKNRWYLASDAPNEKLVRLRCSDRLLNDYYRLKTQKDDRLKIAPRTVQLAAKATAKNQQAD